jgi:hypothetical protein
MSDQSPPSQGPDTVQTLASDAAPATSGPGWLHRLSSVILIIICFELGLFLLIYPWTSAWSDNYFAWALHGAGQAAWHSFWNNSYIRGCVSGIGILNLWIAVAEVYRMFSRRVTPAGS